MPRLTVYDKIDTFESSSNGSIWLLSAIAGVLFAMLIGLVFMN